MAVAYLGNHASRSANGENGQGGAIYATSSSEVIITSCSFFDSRVLFATITNAVCPSSVLHHILC